MLLMNEEILKMEKVLEGYKTVGKKSLALAVKRNLNKFEPEIKILKDTFKPDDKYIEFLTKQKTTLEKFCKKKLDAQGNPTNELDVKISGDQIYYNYTAEDSPKVQAELNDLSVEYTEAIEAYTKLDAEYKEELKKEIELDIVKIKFSELPDDANANDIDILDAIIEYD